MAVGDVLAGARLCCNCTSMDVSLLRCRVQGVVSVSDAWQPSVSTQRNRQEASVGLEILSCSVPASICVSAGCVGPAELWTTWFKARYSSAVHLPGWNSFYSTTRNVTGQAVVL